MWESLDALTIWGGTGVVLTTLHSMGLPYWSGFAITNILVRTTLIPFVLHSAHTAARFAKVAPEVQFLVSVFQNDLKRAKDEGAPKREQRFLFTTTMKTMRAIYKINKINPLAIFVSPILQIPFFWYASIDLRKIINGGDPELANQLTESGFLWVADLTEPDPWYGLPIMGGLLLYYNVEVAVGKKSLSGETASQSNILRIMKDGFQSLAIFMPCFMSHSPAGMQIYLATSFLFTLGQGYALRNDTSRAWVGLPSMNAPKPDPETASEFIKLKQLQQKAKEERGDGKLLGVGVLQPNYQGTFFPGTNRPSTIAGSNPDEIPEKFVLPELPGMVFLKNITLVGADGLPFVHGVSAPPDQLEESRKKMEELSALAETNSQEREYLEEAPLDVMEAANRGERATPLRMVTEEVKEPKKFSAKRFQRNKGGRKSKRKR
jgi:membrane protein insertase Oxa1/YidC/SpoIIIJ